MDGIKRIIVCFGILGLLGGCGGGGGGSDDSADSKASAPSGNDNSSDSQTIRAGGIYRGTATSKVTNDGAREIIGVVAENKRAFFYAPNQGTLYAGTIDETKDTLTGPLTQYAPDGTQFPNGAQESQLSLQATVKPKNTLTGSYSGGGDKGTFSLNYQSVYEKNSSLSEIAGIYSQNQVTDSGSYTLTITIDSKGLVTGSDTTGCVLNGRVSLINKDYNAYDVTVAVSSCGPLNGRYKGLAALLTNTNKNDSLVVGTSNNNEAVARILLRQ